MTSRFSSKLLTCTALASIMALSSTAAFSADRSVAIEAGGTVNIDGADTFVVDSTNNGNAGTAIVFNNNAANAVDSLTISSNGTATSDTGILGSVTVEDNNGTNTLVVQDSTNGDPFRLNILGNINGNVATNANDLRIVIHGSATNDTGDTVLAIGGNVDLGSGGFQIHSDADNSDISTLIFNGTSAQTITGTINATEFNDFTDPRDSTGFLQIGETGTNSNVTFNSAIGNVGTLESVSIVAGSTATFKQNVSTEANANTDAGFLVTGTANIDTTGNTVEINEALGDIVIDGTANVIGANNATLYGDSNIFLNGTLNTFLTGANRTLTLETNTGSIEFGANGGATIVAGNQIVTNSDLNIGNNGTGNNTINIRKTADFDPATNPVINAAGDVVSLGAGSTLTIGIDTTSLDFGNGAAITVIDSDQNAGTSWATLVGNNSIIFQDTAFYDIEDDASDAQDLNVTVVLKSTIDGTSGQNSETLRQAVLATQSDAAVRSALLTTSAAQTNNAAASLQGDSTGGAATTQAIATNMSSGFDTVSSRLSDIREGKGVSSGDGTANKNLWIRGFGATSDQDNRDGVQGYDAQTYGTMVGIDKLLESDVRIGASAGYSYTDVDTNGAGNQNTDIDTYRVGLYGGKSFQKYYVEGQASFAYNDIETSRNIPLAGVTAQGDTDGYEYGARIGAGIPLSVGQNKRLTPYADFQYIHADVDSYTETGAGVLNTSVDNDGIDIAELVVGTRYAADYATESGVITPSLRAAASYDFIGDTTLSEQQFTGGGAAFDVEGADVAQFGINYGAGLSWETNSKDWEFSLNYDGKAKSDYISHGGRLEAKLKF